MSIYNASLYVDENNDYQIDVDYSHIKDSFSGELVVAKQDDESDSEYFERIGEIINMLLENEYACIVKREETDITIIQYEHDESLDEWGCSVPMWVSDEERDLINDFRGNILENINGNETDYD